MVGEKVCFKLTYASTERMTYADQPSYKLFWKIVDGVSIDVWLEGEQPKQKKTYPLTEFDKAIRYVTGKIPLNIIGKALNTGKSKIMQKYWKFCMSDDNLYREEKIETHLTTPQRMGIPKTPVWEENCNHI